MSEAKTLRELREEKGLSVEELAEKAGIPERQLARWEKLGLPYNSDTMSGQLFMQEVFRRLSSVLDLSGGVLTEDAPNEPEPGELVINERGLVNHAPPEVLDWLYDHAAEIGLRRALFSPEHGVYLKPNDEVTEEDWQAIGEYDVAELSYRKVMHEHISDLAAMMGEHATSPDETVEDILPGRGGRVWPMPPRKPDKE